MMNLRRQPGFTLIELMIVVSIIAILTAIALPSYRGYVIRADRSAAQSFMLKIATLEEQYRLDARNYTATWDNGGLNLTAPSETSGKYTFAVTLADGPPPGYTITATATGAQTSDGDLSLDSDGTKTPADKWK